MQAKTLHIETDQRGVCTVTLNRAERHNAFNAELIDELITAFNSINNDADSRVVVLTGAGSSFSSGADLEWMRDCANFDEATNRKDAKKLAALMRTLYDLNKPTIARINGPAYGGALGLIACCDIAIASDTAQFAFTEVRLGLVPAVISPYILMAIGPRHTRRLFLTAESISSDKAVQLQLIHQAVAAAELDAAVEKQIAYLLKAGPEALRSCKKLIPRFSSPEVDAELAALIAALRVSPEGQEGLAAFLEKRKPAWFKNNK